MEDKIIKKMNKKRRKKQTRIPFWVYLIIPSLLIFSIISTAKIHKYQKILDIYLSALGGDVDCGVMSIYERGEKK